MLQKQKKIIITGLAFILLPPLFIFMGGIPALSELFGLGEGFAYAQAYLLFLFIFIGLGILFFGIYKAYFKSEAG